MTIQLSSPCLFRRSSTIIIKLSTTKPQTIKMDVSIEHNNKVDSIWINCWNIITTPNPRKWNKLRKSITSQIFNYDRKKQKNHNNMAKFSYRQAKLILPAAKLFDLCTLLVAKNSFCNEIASHQPSFPSPLIFMYLYDYRKGIKIGFLCEKHRKKTQCLIIQIAMC